MITGAIVANHVIGRLPTAESHRLPVESFPRRIGAWQAGPDQPTAEVLRDKLPTAVMVERSYIDGAGRSVDLLLLTASQKEDIHDPAACFPSQGWDITQRRRIVVDGQALNVMQAQQDGQTQEVAYWEAGVSKPTPLRGTLLRRIYDARSRIFGVREGTSLLVRIIAPGGAPGRQALIDFTGAIITPLRALSVETGSVRR